MNTSRFGMSPQPLIQRSGLVANSYGLLRRCHSSALMTSSLRDAIPMTRRLGDHQEPHRLIRYIAKAVVRARRHLYALAHGQRNRAAIGLHDGLTAKNVEKLPGFPVAMR